MMVLEINLLVYVIGQVICVLSYNFVDESKTKCNPAEEFTEYQLHFVYVKNINFSSHINIEVNDEEIGNCFILHQKCHYISTDSYNLSMAEINRTIIVTLTIKSVSRKTSTNDLRFSAWVADRPHEKRLDCNATVFSRGKGLSCASNTSKTGVMLACSAQRMYPQGICSFHINKTFQNVYVESKNEAIQGIPTYFSSVCTLLLPTSSISPGKYDINITLYPNVSNMDKDVHYGISYKLSIRLEKPSVTLVDCNDNARKRNKDNCICKSSDNTTNDVIVLYDLRGKAIRRSRSSSVEVHSTTLETGFICRATNIFGWESEPVFYEPKKEYKANRTGMILIYSFGSGGALVTIILSICGCILKKIVFTKEKVGSATSGNTYLDVVP